MGQNSKPPEIYDANKREALICATFRRALNLEEEIAALVAEHIKPLKDDLKEAWGDAKAKLNMPTKDLKLQYAIFRRQHEVLAFDDEAERNRCQDAAAEIFAALEKGQMLNFLDVLEAADRDETDGFTKAAPAAKGGDTKNGGAAAGMAKH